MKCKYCDKKIKPGQPVCPFCGKAQDGAQQVSLGAVSTGGKKKKLTKKQLWIRIGIIAGAVVAALAITVITVISTLLSNVRRGSDIGGSGSLNIDPTVDYGTDVTNIALFGLDSRKDDDVGRSDSMIILSIDRKHDQIKMTSLARDSFVAVEGHGYTKLTHAWAYGKAKLAVKTLNQNFGMNITDYVYVNFYEFVELIDYIGGVDIELTASELKIVNNYYAPELNQLGIKCPPVAGTGLQRLTGAQALAYSRNRYSDSDVGRGDRQKKVLQAAYEQVKQVSPLKLPGLVSKVLGMCHTNLSNSEILEMGYWALSKQPTFATFNLPTNACKPQGGIYGKYGWVYRYDLDIATQELHNFIYEEQLPIKTNTARPAMPTVTKAPTTGTTAAPTTGSTATKPTETRPIESLPTGSLDPTGPTDPTEPTQPTEPTEPTQPTEPTEPVGPVEPTDPVEPGGPDEPNVPGTEGEG